MSFDVIVIRPNRILRSLNDMSQSDTTSLLGTLPEVRARCSAAFPGLMWQTEHSGLFEGPDQLAIEFSIPESDAVESLHLALHFGGADRGGTSQFEIAMGTLFRQWGWQSFAVSDNSAIVESADA